MNLVLFEKKDFVDDRHVLLKGRQFLHARDILHIKTNDVIRVGALGGLLGKGAVVELGKDSLKLRVSLDEEPPQKLGIILILSLPRPLVFRRLLSAVAAMGVRQIVFIQSVRVEKSYWNSPALNEENVRQALISGLEQSRDTLLPDVSFEKRFKPFMDKRLPLLREGKKCFLAHPEKAKPCPSNVKGQMVLAVGPEGGFVPSEVEAFEKAAFLSVHLGPRILRVETAVQALLGRTMSLTR
ncbi:MAG: 16S rRNA (uracil(1498)-N(3))-methyltransferase [Candidatus Omnitrophota bacterium]